MFFHGSSHKIDNFTDDFVGGKDANDQEGPGIYFTSSYKNARSYGPYVYTVKLHPKKLISTENGKNASLKEIEWLIKKAPNWKETAQNWNENYNIGYKIAAKDFIQYNENPHQQFLQVWIDFYRNNPVDYARNMVKLGYDAVKIEGLESIIAQEGNINHIVVLNPAIIELVKVEDDRTEEEKKISEIRKFVRTVLKESFIEEDYPIGFDMAHFKSLKNFKERIEYCEKNLERLSSGSARIVYKIDNEKVLKLAKNPKGIAQNETEIQWGNDSYFGDILANTIDYHPDNLWVEMELARKAKRSEFKRLTGFDINEINLYLRNFEEQKNGRRAIFHIEPELEDRMNEDEFVKSLTEFMDSADAPAGDFGVINSYGIVKRDGEERVVLIDYGLTKDIYSTHYDKTRRKMSIYEEEESVNNINDNFWKWFAGSKVVDKNGNPMPVHHGTAQKFSKFNLKKATQGIIWFTSNKASIEAGEVGAQGIGHIMDLYVSMKNPAGWDEYGKYGLGQLESMGYDGVILPDPDGTFTGFVFNANQLKSIANKGEWNPGNNNIFKEEDTQRELGKSLAGQMSTPYVTIYRAAPFSANEFFDRDYVTLSKKFAIEHAENNHVYHDEPFHVIQAIVSTKNIFDAYNPGEYFYSGPNKKAKEIYVSKGPHEYEGLEESINDNLWKWFADSKVVDKNGNPLVVYHGTNKKRTFTGDVRGDIGIHFGTKKSSADRLGSLGIDNGDISGYFLYIKNPIKMRDVGAWADFKPVADELLKIGIISKNEYMIAENFAKTQSLASGKEHKILVEILKSKGYDGIIYKNTSEDIGSTSYIVFDTSQIKEINLNTENNDLINEKNNINDNLHKWKLLVSNIINEEYGGLNDYQLTFSDDEYCSDWWEPAKGIVNEAAIFNQGGILLIKGAPLEDGTQRLYATSVRNLAEFKPGVKMAILSDEFYRLKYDEGKLKAMRIAWKNESSLTKMLNFKDQKISVVLNNNKTPWHWKTLEFNNVGMMLNKIGFSILELGNINFNN